jgi:hypothetical protein
MVAAVSNILKSDNEILYLPVLLELKNKQTKKSICMDYSK